jgi:hypothetical protein
MTTHSLSDGRSPANAQLRAWYLRRLRPKLALAVRQRGISSAQAAFDQAMGELLHLSERNARGSLPHRRPGRVIDGPSLSSPAESPVRLRTSVGKVTAHT